MKIPRLLVATCFLLMVSLDRKVFSLKHTHVVVLGGTGDLARKYLWKSFLQLYSRTSNENTTFTFYAGARTSPKDGLLILDKILHNVECDANDVECNKKRKEFIEKVKYVHLKDTMHYKDLCKHFLSFKTDSDVDVHQLFYLSIPASSYIHVAELIDKNCRHENITSTRLVLEKPFGNDIKTARIQIDGLQNYFTEEELYRVDHYLAKPVVKELLQFRNFNRKELEPLLNNKYVDRVEVVLKETIGVKGRIDFYDQYGVVRDVIQNHMTELLALVAMQLPQNVADPKEIESMRLRVLKDIMPVRKHSLLLGQYQDYIREAREEKVNVTQSMFTPTFAAALMEVDNSRWTGVPFLLVTGKQLDERSSYIRVIFREREFCVSYCWNRNNSHNLIPRQIVFQIGHGAVPSPGILVTKSLFNTVWPPGMKSLSVTSKGSIVHGQRPGDFQYAVPIIDRPAYDVVINDVYTSNQEGFVTADRVLALWNIWSSVLFQTESHIPRVYKKGPDTNLNFYVHGNTLHYKKEDESNDLLERDRPTDHHISSIPSSFRNVSLICKDNLELLQHISLHLKSSARQAIAERGEFHLALPGGNTPVPILRTVVESHSDFPWQATHIWLVDERCVPFKNTESNFKSIQDNLLNFVKIPYINIHPMPVDVAGRICHPNDEGDILYKDLFKNFIFDKIFDFVMLGIGTDGHIASLFPNSPLLDSTSGFVAFTQSNGAPPVNRMSLLLSVINTARKIIVVVTGHSKHEILDTISRIKTATKEFPVTLLNNDPGHVTYYIDYAAWFG